MRSIAAFHDVPVKIADVSAYSLVILPEPMALLADQVVFSTWIFLVQVLCWMIAMYGLCLGRFCTRPLCASISSVTQEQSLHVVQ